MVEVRDVRILLEVVLVVAMLREASAASSILTTRRPTRPWLKGA
jgi:hypothetical protein